MQLIATILMLIIFYRGFPATSRGAVRPHKNKVGYSVHSDYLLDTYAIRNAVYALPSVDISFDELSKYTLVAL